MSATLPVFLNRALGEKWLLLVFYRLKKVENRLYVINTSNAEWQETLDGLAVAYLKKYIAFSVIIIIMHYYSTNVVIIIII